MRESNQMLKDKVAQKGILIAAHRGTCGGNIIQNTTLAYENALHHSADMIEIDVIMSTDGDFFAFHSGQEKLVFVINQDISKMTTREIQELYCYNALGEKTQQKLERLEQVLAHFKNRCLINIDRSWFYWKEIIQFLNKQGMQDQIVLKSEPNDDLLKQLEEYGPNIMYMPIVKDEEAWDRANQYQLNLVAAELIFQTLDSPLIKPAFIEKLHQSGILTWANAITLNDDIVLSARLDDNHAISDGYEKNWGKLIEMGFDIIQTDWPALLNQYLLNRK